MATTAKLKELREERGKLVKESRDMLQKVRDEEKREFNSEEEQRWDKYMEDIEKLGKDIEREERMADLERDSIAAERGETQDPPAGDGNRAQPQTEAEQRMLAFRKALASGPQALDDAEKRALSYTVDSSGGYLSPPQQFVEQLIQSVDDMVHIRGMATVWQLPEAHNLGVPSLETDPSDPGWTSELSIGSEDSSMAFGKRELHPHPLAKFIKVSNKLLQSATLPADAIVRQRLMYKFAVAMEKGFLTGNGAQQPLGVFTADASGISTGRDVSTGNNTTSITFDGLIESKYTLKSQYHGSANWMFHRDAVKQIAKLKDGEGQYLWQPSVREGEPDRILALPFRMSEFAPNTFTTGQYVGILGDFSYYWIADALDMQLQRLIELYAGSNQTGFIGRMESDGMPVLEEAFVRVKLP